MAVDYQSIRTDNERRYGTDIGRIGPMLLADRYADRTHFIFELLQNAEDALVRRQKPGLPKAVTFHLTDTALFVSHYGKPFDEQDVRGICGIAESTKDLTDIGRFGIGFKSVYAFTNSPEIHSSSEDFVIENYVWPVEAQKIPRDVDETIIKIPLRIQNGVEHDEVGMGLGRLHASSLLFLREIEEIRWDIEGGNSGHYLRDSKSIDDLVRRVTIIGMEQGKTEIDETWLIFSRPMNDESGCHRGKVELAFQILRDEESQRECINRVESSPLVVFFPTAVETHLGFLVQGPYRTTPSRDNVPQEDSWNKKVVDDTSALLVETLLWLREHAFLDSSALRCLPLDPGKFSASSMFAPLFGTAKRTLLSEPLLPRFDTGYVSAAQGRLARTQDLRSLFDSTQLMTLFKETEETPWLSSDITQDRMPDLRRYLMQELGMPEITPAMIIPRLEKTFLESQSDEWILSLYEFLNGLTALEKRLGGIPLIRLTNRTHIVATANGQPQAFLPGPISTGFPTVHSAVCNTETAIEFLKSLGLTTPDPVDDVIRNILPKYTGMISGLSKKEYEADIGRIQSAFATDSTGQREKLVAALRLSAFVMAVDVGDHSTMTLKPDEVYWSTDRLKSLFAGVQGVRLVDDSYACFSGEGARELFEACGTVRYLRPISDSSLSWVDQQILREQAGHSETSGQNDRISDWNLDGLDALLLAIPLLQKEQRELRARFLWEELATIEERRGKGVFSGEYTWTHYGSYSRTFDARFIRKLNETAWVPDSEGELQCPKYVVFETLGWKQNPFLMTKLRFKPPMLDQLALAAGFEPGMLDLLRKLGITNVADLQRFGIKDPSEKAVPASPEGVDDALKKLLGENAAPTSPMPDPLGPEPGGISGSGASKRDAGLEPQRGTNGESVGEPRSLGIGGSHTRVPGSPGSRPFISYIGVHPDSEEADPDGLDQAARMSLEEKAIASILLSEPALKRTHTNNPGYDLFEADTSGQVIKWVEVKAMSGSLHDRPVGMSHTQFELAQDKGETYWLYIVENTGSETSRIVRIQNPACRESSFTFDYGWLNVAEAEHHRAASEDGDKGK